MAADVTVTDNPTKNRYEALVDGEVAGFAEYRRTDEVIAFTHTEVDSAYEGQGVAGQLARGALDAVVAGGGGKVKAICPFIKKWIERHPDYHHLVDGSATAGDEG